MALTKEQRARLDKLAAYLEGLPEDYRHFDMGHWVSGHDPAKVARYARKNGGVDSCGTSACAAGHGPAAGILVPKNLIFGNAVNWWGYSRLFVTGNDHAWCFSGNWDEHDNSHRGAAARIRYLLAHGNAPREFFDVDGESAEEWIALYAPYRIDAKAPADA